MDIIKFDIYRNPNIGVFFQANDSFLVSPPGTASTKISKITKHLKVENISTTIGGSTLIGALSAMNSNGIIVSKLIEGYEEEVIEKETGRANFSMGYNEEYVLTGGGGFEFANFLANKLIELSISSTLSKTSSS